MDLPSTPFVDPPSKPAHAPPPEYNLQDRARKAVQAEYRSSLASSYEQEMTRLQSKLDFKAKVQQRYEERAHLYAKAKALEETNRPVFQRYEGRVRFALFSIGGNLFGGPSFTRGLC
jgi:hypothetical protein